MGTYKKSEYLLQSMLEEGEAQTDKFRVDIGGAWMRDADGKFKPQPPKMGANEKFSKISFGSSNIFQNYEASPYYSITQSVTLKSDSSYFENYSDFVDYIRGTSEDTPAIVTGSYFVDTNISIQVPFSQKEKQIIENSAKPMSYYVKPFYNFYQRNYENDTITVAEQTLPNLYSIYASKSDIDQSPNALNDFDEELLNIGTLLEDIVDTLGPLPPETEILPIQNINFLREANDYKGIFPMYNEIEFSTQRNTVLAEIIGEADLSNSLLNYISGAAQQSLPFAGFREELSVNSEGKVEFVDTAADGIFRTYDLFEWVNKVSEEINKENSNLNIIGPAPEESNKFIKFLNLLKFEAKFQDMINSYLRNYKDILDGIPSYSETVAYKVEKRIAGNLVTTYLFPNSNEIDVYRFVDTQVKYGQKYEYSAFAYQLVLGAEYKYKNLKTSVKNNYQDYQNIISNSNYAGDDQDTNSGTTTSGGSGGGGAGGSRPAGFGGYVIQEPGVIEREDEGTDTDNIDNFDSEEFEVGGENE